MTSEEDLVRQIKHSTGQLANATASARALHQRWIHRAKDQHKVAESSAGVDYRKALHEADTAHLRAVEQAQAQAVDIYRRSGLPVAEWNSPDWLAWQPSLTVEAGQESVRVGELIEDGPAGRNVALPAVARLHAGHNLIIRAAGPAKQSAAGALESVLFRLLTNTLPGHPTLTLLDPSNLLSNVDVLARLTDTAPGLLTGGVWTKPAEVEAVLAYLADRIATGPEADGHPNATILRVVTILDFPSGFSHAAVRHLRALVRTQEASGVRLVISLDPSGPMPDAFDLVELEQAATVIRWDGARFLWEADELRSCTLVLDAPPGDSLAQKLVTSVGAEAVRTLLREFDLSRTLPPGREWWQVGTAHGLCVPIGVRCGGEIATMCLERTTPHLHVRGDLEAGRGDLLRTILMHCAVTYSPDNLRLYLLSLPGGLDVRMYAKQWLPHADVVVVNCTREYALGVLEYLHEQLCAPSSEAIGADGDGSDSRSTEAAIQHLLVLDEFTQLLMGGDEIAVRATAILSRLLDEGRQKDAHVILATSARELPDVARQIAGGIGAHVVFTAGRAEAQNANAADGKLPGMLGLAIYNDAASKPWGDRLIRVPTVTDADEAKLLTQLRAQGETRPAPSVPQAFHDPEALADVARCRPLYRLLMTRDGPVAAPKDENASTVAETTTSAWLGERHLLGQAASAIFWPRDGRHLLVVSDNEPAAVGMLAATILSLGIHAQREPRAPTDAGKARPLSVVDFTAGKLSVLGRVAGVLGSPLEVISSRELPALLARTAQLIDRRLDSQYQSASLDVPWLPDSAPVFIVLAGLHHALTAPRSYDGDAAERFASAERLAKIVQLGTSVGVHVIAWCDAVSSFNAVLGATMLPEFGMRAVTRVSEEDSAGLLDSPAASQLMTNEALLWDRRLGVLQPFRPYGPPEESWLAKVRESTRAKAASRA